MFMGDMDLQPHLENRKTTNVTIVVNLPVYVAFVLHVVEIGLIVFVLNVVTMHLKVISFLLKKIINHW